MQDPRDRTIVPARTHDLALDHLRRVINLCTYLLPVQNGQMQEVRDKNVRVVKDKFSLHKYTRLHSFKYEFSKISGEGLTKTPLQTPPPLNLRLRPLA